MLNVVYLSQIIGRPVIDADGKRIGIVTDLSLATRGDYFPEIDSIVFKWKGVTKKICWAAVNRFSDAVYLAKPENKTCLATSTKKDMLLSKLLLDKQLVDTNGLKVVRVNDIALAEVNNRFSVISFDVGIKGLLRRLGLRRISEYLHLADKLIPWSYVAPVQSEIQHIHLQKPRQDVGNMRPAEIATVLEELSHSERQHILTQLDAETAAEALGKATPELQKSVFENLDKTKAARLLNSITPNKAADMLAVISDQKRGEILAEMDAGAAKVAREIMEFKSNTAGSIMSTNVFSIPEDLTVAQTIERIRENDEINALYSLYVVDAKDRLVGVLPVMDLIRAKPTDKVVNVMIKRPKIIRVFTSTTIEEVAELIARYDLLAVPVVDSRHRLRGRVKADDVIDFIIPPAWRKRLPRISAKQNSLPNNQQ